MSRNVFGEARIIIPCDVSPMVRASAERQLLEAFGGFTRSEAFGAWLPSIGAAPICEAVFVYDVACAAFTSEAGATGIVSHESERAFLGASRTLATIARNICRDGAQESVYVRHPTGEVQLIGLRGALADAAGPSHAHAATFWQRRSI
jgi:hypothetical protein